MKPTPLTLRRDLRRTVTILRRNGFGGIRSRAVAKLSSRLGGNDLADFPLFLDDVVSSSNLTLPEPSHRPEPGSRLRIGWVCAPPALGSGGHTTLFRMVQALEQAGHECVLFFYDRYAGDLAFQTSVLRAGWPGVRAEVRDARLGIENVDAAIASSWPSAHALARYGTSPMRRLYFIQDFEPYFYPQGSEYALAEDTYRFGFTHIALGHMISSVLDSMGLASSVVEFGCDTDVYRFIEDSSRRGVVFFARPGVPRRGFVLGCLALQEFHRRFPDEPIHVYGTSATDLGFPAVQHGKLTPAQLDRLYGSAVAGLGLSFTNVTLVAEEMLAAGVIPVLNESPHARAGIDNTHVRWAEPSPAAVADALGELVGDPDAVEPRAAAAAASVGRRSWRPSQQAMVGIVQDAVYGTGSS